MIYFYFPGNGKINKGEKDSFENMLKTKGFNTYAHEWRHWEDESLNFDKDIELERVKKAVENENIEDYAILGKSIGTYFACEFIKNEGKDPKLIILMGIPLGIGEERLNTIKEVLKNTKAKIYVIQNNKDPYGSLEELKNLLEGINYTEIIKDSDTHIYNYANEVAELLD